MPLAQLCSHSCTPLAQCVAQACAGLDGSVSIQNENNWLHCACKRAWEVTVHGVEFPGCGAASWTPSPALDTSTAAPTPAAEAPARMPVRLTSKDPCQRHPVVAGKEPASLQQRLVAELSWHPGPSDEAPSAAGLAAAPLLPQLHGIAAAAPRIPSVPN